MWNKLELIRLKYPSKVRICLLATRFFTKDYYSVLDLKRTATKREIKQAYYRLSKKYHPDINSEANASEKFKDIHEAYQILGDEKKKLEYDMSLNPGHYPSRSEGEFTFRSYKRRTGPIYPSNSSFNFDEHFQAHYGQGFKRASPSYRAHQSKKMSQEELKNYWKKKEFSDEDYLTNLRNQFFYRSLIVIIILTTSFLIIKQAKNNEEEKGRQARIHNINQNNK